MKVTLETLKADMLRIDEDWYEGMGRWNDCMECGGRIGGEDCTCPWKPRCPDYFIERWEQDVARLAEIGENHPRAWMYNVRKSGWQFEYYNAAKLYTIGRDNGLDAAMLYKLSGGNIDPRKGGDA